MFWNRNGKKWKKETEFEIHLQRNLRYFSGFPFCSKFEFFNERLPLLPSQYYSRTSNLIYMARKPSCRPLRTKDPLKRSREMKCFLGITIFSSMSNKKNSSLEHGFSVLIQRNQWVLHIEKAIGHKVVGQNVCYFFQLMRQ